jgi:hypothetical protein
VRRAKCPTRLPRGRPLVEWLLPVNARSGSWQLAQLVPLGSERLVSKKMARPIAARTAGVGTRGDSGCARESVPAPAGLATATVTPSARVRTSVEGDRLRGNRATFTPPCAADSNSSANSLSRVPGEHGTRASLARGEGRRPRPARAATGIGDPLRKSVRAAVGEARARRRLPGRRPCRVRSIDREPDRPARRVGGADSRRARRCRVRESALKAMGCVRRRPCTLRTRSSSTILLVGDRGD